MVFDVYISERSLRLFQKLVRNDDKGIDVLSEKKKKMAKFYVSDRRITMIECRIFDNSDVKGCSLEGQSLAAA